MARWKQKKKARFEDIPESLLVYEGHCRPCAQAKGKKRALYTWLETRGLSVADFLAWELEQRRREQGLPPRKPARRKGRIEDVEEKHDVRW